MDVFSFENLKLYLRVALRHWKGIVVSSLGATLVISLWLFSRPDEYVSETEFVPPDLSTASPLLREAALVPGTASDLERVYSYLNSFALRQALIDSFNLYTYYHLDRESSPRKRAQALNAILNRVLDVRITRNSTILLSVRDTSPDHAYAMTAFLVRQVERFCKGIIRMDESLQETENQLQKLSAEIRSLEESLSSLRVKYRIFTSGENRNGAISLGGPEALAHYDKVLSQETRLIRLQEAYARLLEEKIRREDFLKVYPQVIFIIQPPYKPIFTSGLSRWLLFLITLVGSFILSCILFLYAYYIGLLPDKNTSYKNRVQAAVSSNL
ncbi:MAG: hypothetical protein N2170_01475 [Bacteroidia bacterium]|nr:hypothetical protein [Bacteroidia bacterium]